MGYQTDYTLDIKSDTNHELMGDNKIELEDVIEWAEEHADELDYGADPFKEINDGGSFCAKWYDHDKDMRKVSLAFPGVLFCLHGEGEEEEDKWDKYFLNGKMQVCGAEITIVYPPFDPRELK